MVAAVAMVAVGEVEEATGEMAVELVVMVEVGEGMVEEVMEEVEAEVEDMEEMVMSK